MTSLLLLCILVGLSGCQSKIASSIEFDPSSERNFTTSRIYSEEGGCYQLVIGPIVSATEGIRALGTIPCRDTP